MSTLPSSVPPPSSGGTSAAEYGFRANSNLRIKPLRALFESPRVEREFLQSRLAHRRALGMCLILLGLAVNLVFSGVDSSLVSADWQVLPLAILRVGFVLLSVIALGLSAKARSAGAFLITMNLWTALVVLSTVLVNLTRVVSPAGYQFDLIIAIAIYFALPLRLTSRVVFASTLLLADMSQLFMAGAEIEMAPQRLTILILSLSVVGLVGPILAWRRAISDRESFARLATETALRARLERALTEVRTLRAILPTCSCCGRIRRDDGGWESLEEHVGSQTDARFSHGVCPPCLEEHYPGVMVAVD